MADILVDTTLTTFACGSCGGVYAIGAAYVAEKRKQGGYWRCPYCNGWWGFGESDYSKLEKNLAAERARHDQTRAALETEKSAKTKIKNRVAHGVCPCCKRTFSDLARHMKGKHPDFCKETARDERAG